ncbi:MAG: O-antigen ligase family protein [Chthoniobacter sp.]|nr:O-antigen ligase family protein [Chthoniobacter sp.]
MLQDNPLWNRFTSRLQIAVAMFLVLVLTFVLAVSIGGGDFMELSIIIGACVAVAAVLALGEKYWLLIPFAFTFQLEIIPIGIRSVQLPELIICVCVVTFVARYAMKLQKFTLFRSSHTPVLLYIGWAAMIFCLHPVGLWTGGAAMGGARYYVKLVMALASFLVMANQKITNRDCLWIMGLVIVGAFFSSFANIFDFFYGRQYGGLSAASVFNPDDYYSWHQNLVIVPIVVFPVLFARYRASEIFSLKHPWLTPLIVLSVLAILASGKRMGIISVPVIAVGAALVRKEWGFLTLWVGGAFMAMTLVVIGHGNFFQLPITVQRTLSWLPGQWDAELAVLEGGADPFRTRLNELATDRIQRDPWVGLGYSVDMNLVDQIHDAEGAFSLEAECLSAAVGSQWHNTWLGTAADFGIPAAFLLANVVIYAMVRGAWLFKRLTPGSGFQTLALYVVLCTFRDVSASWHGGQSAETPFGRFWMYGILTSLVVMLENMRKKEPGLIGERGPLTRGFGAPLPVKAGESRHPVLHRSSSGAL